MLCTDDVDDNVFNLDFILAICSFGLLYVVGLNDESIDGIVEVQLVDSTLKPEALKSLYRSPGNKKNQLVLCKNYVLQW